MDEDLVIEEVEFVKEEERLIVDDEIYKRTLEESFLDTYPISRQNDYLIQNKVKEEAENFLQLTHKYNNTLEYPNTFVKQIMDENYKFITPITSNEKK